MSAKNNGGPAFPTAADNGHSTNQDGMTLRDYFAAKAMNGYISARAEGSMDEIAEYSYKYADAMLKVREGGGK